MRPTKLLSSLALLVLAAAPRLDAACKVPDADGGANHTLVVDSVGTVWAFGAGDRGQLGNGGTADSTTPVVVSGLTTATKVAGGGAHSLAILGMSGSGVVAWGAGDRGQLGNGATSDSTTPVTVTGLSGITAVRAGAQHSLALKSDGTVWSWGANTTGQLGDGTHTDATAPAQVAGLASIIDIAAGDSFSMALKSDGTVYTWGDNLRGQLGDGTTTERTTPVTAGVSGVAAIAAGGSHALALLAGGTVKSFGAGTSGQLGNGGTSDSSTAVTVSGLTGITSIAAGSAHSLAVRTDGIIKAWGANAAGQLGDNSTTASSTPVTVALGNTQVIVAAGGDTSLALRANLKRTPSAWGRGSRGQLGDGTTQAIGKPATVWFFLTSTTCGCSNVVDWNVGYTGAGQAGVNAYLTTLAYATIIGQVGTPSATDANQGAYLVQLAADTWGATFFTGVSGQPGVRYAERDCVRFAKACGTPTFPVDPGFRPENAPCSVPPNESLQWGLVQSNFETGFSRLISLANPRTIKVAVLDTGAWKAHPDLAGGISYDLDLVNGTYVQMGSRWYFTNDSDGAEDDDPNRHGTMMAGIIGAASDTVDQGITGAACRGCLHTMSAVPTVTLQLYKVLDAEETGTASDLAAGIIAAKQMGAEIISMSLGGTLDSQLVRDACAYARNPNLPGTAGALLIASAGNEGAPWLMYPAAYQTVFAVGASTAANTRASWSNYGTGVDLFAPGNGLSLGDLPYPRPVEDPPVTKYAYADGTSVSAAMVTGAAALGKSLRPANYCPNKVEETLKITGTVMPDSSGKRLNVGAFIDQLLLTWGMPPCSTAPAGPQPGTEPPYSDDCFSGGGFHSGTIIPSFIP